MLQQTRVQQGMPYYLKFVEHYPTVHDLANAPLEEVLRLWQGLGYYSRARNLHQAAQFVSQELHGDFPQTYQGLLKLKGVGAYTAAAIASFAFGERVAVVDGNVYRVLARFFGVEEDIASHAGQKIFASLAQELLPDKESDTYNQAIMEFGALHCKPANPDCLFCPLAEACEARKQGRVGELPVKVKKLKVKTRHCYYCVFRYENSFLVNKREGKGIWQGLYDFHCIEAPKPLEHTALVEQLPEPVQGEHWNISEISPEKKHILTHQRIFAHFLTIEADSLTELDALAANLRLEKVDIHGLHQLPKPVLIDNYLKEFVWKNA